MRSPPIRRSWPLLLGTDAPEMFVRTDEELPIRNGNGGQDRLFQRVLGEQLVLWTGRKHEGIAGLVGYVKAMGGAHQGSPEDSAQARLVEEILTRCCVP